MKVKRRHSGRRRRCREPPEPEAVILDFRPPNPNDRHREHREHDFFQLMGAYYFTLMEALPRYDVNVEVQIGDRIFLLGEKSVVKECSIVFIDYEELSPYAKSKLEELVPEIVKRREKVFVHFFNTAPPINIRFHMLELLPGIGKKTMMKILEERERKPFDSFEDIKKRVRIDPVKVISERILREIRGEERYYLFVNPPPKARRRRDIVVIGILSKLYEEVGGIETPPSGEEGSAQVGEEPVREHRETAS